MTATSWQSLFVVASSSTEAIAGRPSHSTLSGHGVGAATVVPASVPSSAGSGALACRHTRNAQ